MAKGTFLGSLWCSHTCMSPMELYGEYLSSSYFYGISTIFHVKAQPAITLKRGLVLFVTCILKSGRDGAPPPAAGILRAVDEEGTTHT